MFKMICTIEFFRLSFLQVFESEMKNLKFSKSLDVILLLLIPFVNELS